MTHIAKPRVFHPGLEKNEIGLTQRDYEGVVSTLCAGCGHDSVTGALVEAAWELALPTHRVAKMSGIGCSSKTTAYFMSQSHGFNSVHGRMPSVASGANAANRDLVYIGVSGDGDSLSIGLGQLCHAMRRNLNLLYLIENNGVYGLTKGQFSASADVGAKSKRGVPNEQPPIDPVLLALSLGATFAARGFSGDRKQLVPIIKAGIRHPGLALVDVISPCVTFNDHVGSTKSYAYTRERFRTAVEAAFLEPKDFVPSADEITAELEPGGVRDVRMHDGSFVRFRQTGDDYDPTDRDGVYSYVRERVEAGEVPTGLLFIDPESRDLHEVLGTVERPLVDIPFTELCPGAEALDSVMESYR